MIIKIKMFSKDNIVNLKINNDKNFAEYNGKEINQDFHEEVEKLIEIFSQWKKSDNFVRLLDDETINVEVIENRISKDISFSGDYPENIEDFKMILKEIIRCF